jgi:3-hydroxyacyl-[acyl-carrier protein] dehydratase/trans-2-decenoyl-[acyl-carrier protein] isomerase
LGAASPKQIFMSVTSDTAAKLLFWPVRPGPYGSTEAVSESTPVSTSIETDGPAPSDPFVPDEISDEHPFALIVRPSGTCLPCGGPRLPIPPLLALREITHLSRVQGAGEARARTNISDLSWVFTSHFPGDPVFPGTMILDGLFQLMGIYCQYIGFQGRGRASRVLKVQFRQEVTPVDKLLEFHLNVTRIVHAKQILVCDGSVRADGKICVVAKSLVLTIITGPVMGLPADGEVIQ